MTPWTAWYPDVLPHVMGCPQDIVLFELRRSAQEFFRRTRAWMITQGPTFVAAGTTEIAVEPDDFEVNLVRIEAVYFDDDKLTPMTSDSLDGYFRDTWQDHSAGKPDAWFSDQFGLLSLYPKPLTDSLIGLRVRMSVCPSDVSQGIEDDQIAAKYREVIVNGAKGRLMLYPKAAWANESMGAAYLQAFNTLADRHHVDAARSFSNARMPARVKWC